MQDEIPVHALGESVVDGARVGVERREPDLRPRMLAPPREVAVEAVAPEPACGLAPRAQQPERDAAAVVLHLHVAQRVPRGLQVLGADVRDAVRGAPDLDLRGEGGRGRRGRLRGGERGQREEGGGEEAGHRGSDER